MELGRVLRLGRITHDELRSEFAEYVSLDGIVERRSRDLKERKTVVETAVADIGHRAELAEGLLAKFAQLDHSNTIFSEEEQLRERYRAGSKAAVQAYDAATRRMDELGGELQTTRTAGLLRRLFLRSEQSIELDARSTEAHRSHHHAESVRLGDLARASDVKLSRIEGQIADMKRELASQDRSRLLRQKAAFQVERQPLLDELARINKALSDIQGSVKREAAVIGATVTKCYLSAKDLPAFDAVIVDEASMVLLPALYYAAGLANERVVVSGDFRQLPPIVQTEQEAILKEIGSDVLHTAGIVNAFENGILDRRLVMLDEQYRMDAEICNLISGPMYGGKLRTSPERESNRTKPEDDLLSGTLTIVDTSQLWPFETQTPFGSRYNLMHALVVRNLFLHLRNVGFLRTVRSAGICTPYAAQAKLFRKLVEDEELKELLQASTIHRYQGDEKSLMILEVPESVGGGHFVGGFLQGDHPDDAGARLFNVAVSRAQEHLVFVANLTYLDDRLPGGALLRDFLFQAQTRGRVIDARDVLTLRPADLRGLTPPIAIDLDTQRTGLFGQQDFDAVFRADVDQAKHSIVIFSGFVTPERVATYGDLLRRKILEGVVVRCVTRPPQHNGSIPPELGKKALDALEGIKVIVDCRRNVHQKIVVVDSCVVWFGSLNPLSHTARADETMLRTQAPHFADELLRQTAIGPSRRQVGEPASVEAENPRCGDCGGRTYYVNSRKHARFFVCEAQDGWTQDADRAAAAPVPGSLDLPEVGPPCPKCGSDTRRRHGPHGYFFSCGRFPDCDGKFNARQATKKLMLDRRADGRGA